MATKQPAWHSRNWPVWAKRSIRFLVGAALLWLLLNLLFPLKADVQYSPMVFDAHGELLHTWLTHDEKWRMQVQPEDITPLLKKTILAKEDQYFYYHPGVNPLAIVRALFNNTTAGRRTSGASTITMQVARMLHPKRRTVPNKITEMFRALQLEMRYSKDEILRLYLNLAPYGGNIEGIRSAAWLYFDKEPDHLSLAEITALSVIPNKPNSLTPGKHNDAIIAERNRWLHWMTAQKLFTPNEIENALLEPFDIKRLAAPRHAPHLSLKLRNSGAGVMHSTLHLNKQLKAETLVQNYVRSLHRLNIRNAAVVVVNNKTMEVEAYVGSADFFDAADGGQVNGAAATRQPGSTLKPLVYGLGIDAGHVTPKKIIADVPVNYQGYVPENYDRKFNGQVSMEFALNHSLNIPAVNMLKQVSVEKMTNALVNCRFKQIKKDQQKLGLSLILGGCGTSLEELTGLYSMIANNGLYQPFRFTADALQEPGIRILSQETAFMLHEILSQTDRPDFPMHWGTTENTPRIAWKTGTSYGRRDAWSIGYNASYTIGVWVGNFSGQGIPELSGASIATPLLFSLFNAMEGGNPTPWYTPPAHLEQRIVCAETGLPPNHFCSQKILDYFIPLLSKTDRCNNRREIAVSSDEKTSYCNDCMPENGYRKKWYPFIPPEVAAFQKEQVGIEKIPPHYRLCQKVWSENGPLIRSPDHNADYYLSRTNPEPILLQCQPDADVATVHWYINDKHYKTAPARERLFFMPTEGRQKISCTDDKGRNRNVMIEVRWVDL